MLKNTVRIPWLGVFCERRKHKTNKQRQQRMKRNDRKLSYCMIIVFYDTKQNAKKKSPLKDLEKLIKYQNGHTKSDILYFRRHNAAPPSRPRPNDYYMNKRNIAHTHKPSTSNKTFSKFFLFISALEHTHTTVFYSFFFKEIEARFGIQFFLW